MDSKLIRKVLFAAAVAGIASRTVRADVFNDATADQAGGGTEVVDITSVQVTNDATSIAFKINLTGDISMAGVSDYGNYHIGFDTAPGGKTNTGVLWGQNFGMSGGMDYWIGSWVNFGGGTELHQYTGDGTSNTWGDTIAGTTATLGQFSTTLTIPLTAMGLSNGSVIKFDVWTTFGVPGGQSAYDALSKPTLTVADPWNGTAYDSGANISTYTVAIGAGGSSWNVNADGNWTTAGNWQGGVPNAVGAAANFGAVITAPHAVTVDAPITVGTISFDNVNSYSVGGASAMTLDTTGAAAAINVNSGSHVISAPILLNKDANVTVAAGSALSLSGNMTATGRTITKSGGGALAVKNVRAAALNVSQGSVSVIAGRSTASTSNVAGLSVSAGATLNLNDQDLAIDYTGASPLAAVSTLLTSGYNNAQWNGAGIDSGAAHAVAIDGANNHKTGLGFAEASAIGTTLFSGQTVDSTAVLVRYTYYGDSNLSGSVDSLDFNALAANFGQSGKSWVHGDYNYDGKVDSLDFNALASNFGLTLASPLGDAVPEPGCIAAALLPILLIGRRRRA